MQIYFFLYRLFQLLFNYTVVAVLFLFLSFALLLFLELKKTLSSNGFAVIEVYEEHTKRNEETKTMQHHGTVQTLLRKYFQ